MNAALLTEPRHARATTDASNIAERLVFVGGLHRSGTSLLAHSLGEHPAISTFRNTGVLEDEGQHLQRVYLPAKAHGGPGKFGFASAAHLTEGSPLVNAENAARLLESWRPYWDCSCERLLEKSPPNLIRARFLQALFPAARFIMIVRHPIAVSLATQKWSWTSLESLMAHWQATHRVMEDDLPQLRNVTVVRYEDFIAEPQKTLQTLHVKLGLAAVEASPATDGGVNAKYFRRWRTFASGLIGRLRVARLRRLHEGYWQNFGYSFDDPWRATSA